MPSGAPTTRARSRRSGSTTTSCARVRCGGRGARSSAVTWRPRAFSTTSTPSRCAFVRPVRCCSPEPFAVAACTMRPEEGVVRKVRRRDEVARLEAEIERARPYLALAHEIRAEVDRVAEQADGNIDVLVDAIDAIPTRERHAVALAVFRQLPADRRWDVLERVFGDDELMAALAVER